jgi:transcription initiation factor TFIIB
MEICSSCNSKLILDALTGEKACSKCGQVIEQEVLQESPLSMEPEPRQTQSEMFYKRFLPAQIFKGNTDAFGKKITNQYETNRIRLIEKRTYPMREKIYNRNINELEKISDHLQLKQIVTERAFYIYQKWQKQEMSKGRTIIGILLACIYIACLEHEIPFPQKQLDNSGIRYSKKIINQYKKLIVTNLDMNTKYIKPEQYISQICSRLSLNGILERYAMELLKKVNELGLAIGRKPANTAGAVIYLTIVRNNVMKTQNQVAKESGVTTAGMRAVLSRIRHIFPE